MALRSKIPKGNNYQVFGSCNWRRRFIVKLSPNYTLRRVIKFFFKRIIIILSRFFHFWSTHHRYLGKCPNTGFRAWLLFSLPTAGNWNIAWASPRCTPSSQRPKNSNDFLSWSRDRWLNSTTTTTTITPRMQCILSKRTWFVRGMNQQQRHKCKHKFCGWNQLAWPTVSSFVFETNVSSIRPVCPTYTVL